MVSLIWYGIIGMVWYTQKSKGKGNFHTRRSSVGNGADRLLGNQPAGEHALLPLLTFPAVGRHRQTIILLCGISYRHCIVS